MRMLHTSDWHLGRSLYRVDLLDAQAAFLDQLVETVRTERVDCVLVSGDVYDRALPPVDAVRLCDDALRRLAARTQVVLIAGNHDSAHRLGFGADLMATAGVHLRTDPAAVGTPVLVEARRSGGAPAAVYAVPYLEPDLVRTPWELAERSHTAALTAAMTRIRTIDRARPGERRGRSGADGPDERSVVLAHAFVAGGEPSDSERDISVGGVQQVPASVFDGVDYVALGHLHGRQRVRERVRYCGSPLAYSFSEHHHVKGSWLVDLGAGGELNAEFVEAPVPRRLSRLRGRLDELLTADAHASCTDHWLEVTLTDPVRPTAAMERLRRRFPHVLALSYAPEGDGQQADDGRGWAERIKDRTALDIATDFVAEVTGQQPGAAERALLREAFETCRRDEVAQ